jgi:hypothetical protein
MFCEALRVTSFSIFPSLFSAFVRSIHDLPLYITNDLVTLLRADTQLGTCYTFDVTGCNSHGEITDVNASQLTCMAVITNSNCLIVDAIFLGRVQVEQNGWKLIGTYQLLVYANDVNILGGSV